MKQATDWSGKDIEGSAQIECAIVEILQKAKRHPVPFKTLTRDIARRIEFHRSPNILLALKGLVGCGTVTDLGNGEYYWTANLELLKKRVCTIMRSHHAAYPYEPRMKKRDVRKSFSETQTLNAKRNIDLRLFEIALSACKKDGLVVEDVEGGVRLSEFTPPSDENAELRWTEEAIARHIHERCFKRIDLEGLSRRLGVETRMVKTIIYRMLKDGKLIRIQENRYLEPAAIETVKGVVAAALENKQRLRTAEITMLLGQSRSVVVPILEYLDGIGFTRRKGNHRYLIQRSQQ